MGLDLLFLLVGLGVGALLGWLAWGRPLGSARADAARFEADFKRAIGDLNREMVRAAQVDSLREEAERLRGIERDHAALGAQLEERDAAHARQLAELAGRFDTLAQGALDAAQAKFAAAAEDALKRHRDAAAANLDASKAQLAELIAPMRETLGRYEGELKAIEAVRADAYGALKQQLAEVAHGQRSVQAEAAKLSTALRSSGRVAGRWGEEQLANVLRMAGLQEGVDYDKQVSADGGAIRPDFILRLPGNRCLVVDVKCSVEAFLKAADADDDGARAASLQAHARALRTHAEGLAKKDYWKQFAGSADFVVMFVPGENFLAAALEHDRSLLEWAFERKIVLAAPINLIALAKTVAAVRTQDKLAEEARRLGDLAGEMFEAARVMAGHVQRLGRNLGQAVEGYNDFVGSIERNFLPKARRLPDHGVRKEATAIVELVPLDVATRTPSAPELLAAPAAE